MTVFSMPSCANAKRYWRYWRAQLRALCAAMYLGLGLLSLPAQAAQIEPLGARITLDEGEVLLGAEFAVDLGSRLEEALQRGITLTFKLECVLERPRDYWLSEHILTYTQNYRLSYSSLTRQYRLSIGALHQNFATLPDALRIMSKIGSLPLAEPAQQARLLPATRYDASLRLSLDNSQLPKPFQLDALTSNAWKIESKTRRWSFTTP